MSRFTKKLEKERELKVKGLTDSIKPTTQLLLGEGSKPHVKLLESIGLTAQLEVQKDAQREIDETVFYTQKYGNLHYGRDLIKICTAYDLRVRTIGSLKGKCDYEKIATIIDEFCEKYPNVAPNSRTFYVMAPTEYFSEEYIEDEMKSNITIFYTEKSPKSDSTWDANENDKFFEIGSVGREISELRIFRYLIDFSVASQSDTLPMLIPTALYTLLMLICTFFSMSNHFWGAMNFMVFFTIIYSLIVISPKIQHRKWK